MKLLDHLKNFISNQINTKIAQKSLDLPPQQAKDFDRLCQISEIMDSKLIKLPGGIGIGIDSIIGLIPGVGDLVSSGISLWIIYQARNIGVSKLVLSRMIFNTSADTVLGSIPIFGDVFDVFFKANERNMDLLEKCIASPTKGRIHGWVFMLGLFLGWTCMTFPIFYLFYVILF